MKILYRPHCGGLQESMNRMREFESIELMKEFACNELNLPFDRPLFVTPDDIIIGENIGPDPRIGWKETRYVLTKRFGAQHFDDYPQAIGFCQIIQE